MVHSVASEVVERARLAERELKRRLHESQTSKLFGFELEAAEAGRAVLKMQVRSRHKQVHGVVHGGILASLADTAGAIAAYTTVARGTHLATVELKINYLEPVDRGSILAEARVLRRGRNFIIADCEIKDGDKKLAAKALMTFAIGPVLPLK